MPHRLFVSMWMNARMHTWHTPTLTHRPRCCYSWRRGHWLEQVPKCHMSNRSGVCLLLSSVSTCECVQAHKVRLTVYTSVRVAGCTWLRVLNLTRADWDDQLIYDPTTKKKMPFCTFNSLSMCVGKNNPIFNIRVSLSKIASVKSFIKPFPSPLLKGSGCISQKSS